MTIKKHMTPAIKDKIGLLTQVYIWEIISEYQIEVFSSNGGNKSDTVDSERMLLKKLSKKRLNHII